MNESAKCYFFPFYISNFASLFVCFGIFVLFCFFLSLFIMLTVLRRFFLFFCMYFCLQHSTARQWEQCFCCYLYQLIALLGGGCLSCSRTHHRGWIRRSKTGSTKRQDQRGKAVWATVGDRQWRQIGPVLKVGFYSLSMSACTTIYFPKTEVGTFIFLSPYPLYPINDRFLSTQSPLLHSFYNCARSSLSQRKTCYMFLTSPQASIIFPLQIYLHYASRHKFS